MQRAGDRCGGKGEGVDIFAQFFEALFVSDAEALFFIDDQQTELVKLDVFRKQAVGADDDVHLAGFVRSESLLLLRSSAKATEHFYARGKGSEAALERFEVLEGEHGGRGEYGDLLGIGDGLEGGTHGDLGLAVAHVTA